MLGYRALKNGYDTYGVDHSQFTTREEVEYQDKRIKREEELMKQQRNMGITGNYIQYGTNFWNKSPENNYGFGGSEVKPRYWETAQEGKQIYEDVVAHEGGELKPEFQFPIPFAKSTLAGGINIINGYTNIKNRNITDKFKHALLNCQSAQYGYGGHNLASLLSDVKELSDVYITKQNTLDESDADNYANKIGRLVGTKYPNGNCEDILQQYIKKQY